MKRTTAVLVAALLWVAGAGAGADEQPRMSRFTRPDAHLRLVERSDSFDKGSFALWIGRVLVTGKLIIEFDRTPSSEPGQDTEGIAFFEPDMASRRKLPQAVGSFYPLETKVVWLERTPKEVLPPLVGAERTARILTGTQPRYELPVRIVVTRFRTDVECDHRSYGIAYESISLLTPDLVAIGEAKNIGC